MPTYTQTEANEIGDNGRTGQPARIQDRRECAIYATYTDFCRLFETDMKQLYLLAFLLTANHQEAERCFVKALEDAPKNSTVFKEWIRPWAKRTLIKIAIHRIFREPREVEKTYDPFCNGQYRTEASDLIDAVAQLPALDRFAFVMSALEGYSVNECSLLLDRPASKVREVRICALREVSKFEPALLSNVTRTVP